MSARFGGAGLVAAVLFIGQAMAHAEGTLEVDLALSEAHYALGRKDCSVAVQHLQKVLAIAPDRSDAHRLAGDCLMKLDRPLDALPHYREWARLQPADADALAAVERAAERERVLVERRAAREREKEAVRKILHKPSLATLARERSRDRAKSPAPYKVGEEGPGAASDVAAASQKRVQRLEGLRERAEAVLRPAMTSSAADAQRLAAARYRHHHACGGKTDAATPAEQARTWRHWTSGAPSAVVERDQTADCRELAVDIARLAQAVSAVLARCEGELAKSPAVTAAIREEVFARLQAELW